jgi:hypothetical protein
LYCLIVGVDSTLRIRGLDCFFCGVEACVAWIFLGRPGDRLVVVLIFNVIEL